MHPALLTVFVFPAFCSFFCGSFIALRIGACARARVWIPRMELEDFVAQPSVSKLNDFSKNDLIVLANRYEISISKQARKDEIKKQIHVALANKNLLPSFEESERETPADDSLRRLEMQVELRRLELQQVHQQVELRRLEIAAAERQDVGRMQQPSVVTDQVFDVNKCIRLIPPFNEQDVDKFFLLFERVASTLGWPENMWSLLLQCVLTGKAQQAYAALPADESLVYGKVKAAVERAYELVPEAYRQKFRNLRKLENQSYAEFGRDKMTLFDRWCVSQGVKDYDQLRELILIEEFKNCISDKVATYINEQKVSNVSDAARLADEYALTHKKFECAGFSRAVSSSRPEFSSSRPDFSSSRPNVSCNRPEVSSSVGRPGLARSSGKQFDSRGFSVRDRECHYCHRHGHLKADCPVLKMRSGNPKGAGLAVPVRSAARKVKNTESLMLDLYLPFIREGFVSLQGSDKKVRVKILRDTGAVDSFIRSDVLPFSEKSETGTCVPVRGMGLNVISVPLHKVTLECELFSGDAVVAVRPALPMDGVALILGNGLAGSRLWRDASLSVVPVEMEPAPLIMPQDENSKKFPDVFTACAVTRAMAQAKPVRKVDCDTKVKIPLSDLSLSISRGELAGEQQADMSLKSVFEQVRPESDLSDCVCGYFIQDSLLVRKWTPHAGVVGDPVFQVVVPAKLRPAVLKFAHDETGHSGVRKTYDRVLRQFFWPRLKRDVSAYIKTCHVCQLISKPNQVLKPCPLKPIVCASEPFEHLIVDCVGPLPRSKTGSQYLVTVMCQMTRYPAAYSVRSITAKSVVRALTQFFSVFGVPKTLQTDRGSNFTSHLFAQVLRQLRVRHSLASAFHPESQGALERFHQSLKSLLRAYCTELGGDWEEGLPWMLLAAREVVQESTGFSPNELVFGHKVRGVLSVVAEEFEGSTPPRNLEDYVNGFRRRLYLARDLVKDRMTVVQSKMKERFDRRAEVRSFLPGDQVLALCPVVTSPFQAKFAGPFSVLEKLSDQNYLLSMPGRRKKKQICHVNLLKPYYERVSSVDNVEPVPSAVCVAARGVGSADSSVLSVQGSDDKAADVGTLDSALTQGRLKNSETLQNISTLFSHLPKDRAEQLSGVVNQFPELFSDVPGRTHLIEHDVDVGEAKPIKQRFYRVNLEKRKCLDAEITYMLDNGIAEPSVSSWASPCILVPKSDGTPRFCSDFRKLNAVTKSDCFPLPRIDDLVDQVGSAKFLSKFDLLKGFWQIPMTHRAREVSAFITPTGLYSYTVMPFGLRNSASTFQRLMNKVIGDMCGCAVYLDDVVVYSDTWEGHVERIEELFTRLAGARLTVNLAKCEFARATVTYLGRVVGQGEVRPVQAKVHAVEQFPVPVTKKELMRFLGLVGYYRCFCRDFSSVVAPLTNLLRKDVKFVWSSLCQQAFDQVKSLLCDAPVLAAPCLQKPFELFVDASGVGAGAVLTQRDQLGICRPVSYFSKKFNKHQLNYSVIEKETLALILALQHFNVYVNGNANIVVHTDHNPLTFLSTLNCPNQRLIRWSLFLQSYNLDVRYIKGTENVVADALSRAPAD